MKYIVRLFILLAGIFISSNSSAQVDNPVQWKLSTKKVSDCEYELLFTGTIQDPWHVYSLTMKGDDGPMPANIFVDKSADYEIVGKPTEGTPIKHFDKVFEMDVAYFEKTVTFKQKIRLLANKDIVIKGKYEYQACTEEKCIFPPATPFSFNVKGTAECTGAKSGKIVPVETGNTTEPVEAGNTAAAGVIDSEAVAKAYEAKMAKAAQASSAMNTNSNTSTPSTTNFKPEVDDTSIEGKSWFSIFFTGFLWGFAALFTPCVFPLIPMNVTFFLKRSQSPTKGKVNAIVYALSIIVIFITLGLGVSAIWGGGELNSFATSPGFNMVIFLLLLVFAASFLGAFEIVLPSRLVNKIDAQGDRGGFLGIFFMALALVVISFSCTGPMVGNALVTASESGSKAGAFWAMFGFSSGLALPFGLFAFFPSMLNSMPKSGGWLNAVKVSLGFLELALAFKFASNVDLAYDAHILTREVFITLWVVIFGLMTLYLLGLFKTSHDSDVKHLSVTRLFVASIPFFITIYMIPGLWGAPLKLFSGVLPPYEYSESPNGFGGSTVSPAQTSAFDPQFAPYIHTSKSGVIHFKNDYANALAYARKVGKPLMIDFTGVQCANCRKTEDYIWPDSEVLRRLNNDVVMVSLFVDEKAQLDPKDYQKVFWFGQEREITTIGDKFKYMEETLYKTSTQPLYVLIDSNEQMLNAPRGYKAGIPGYIAWLDEGIKEYQNRSGK